MTSDMNPSRNTRISRNTKFGALTVVAVALVVAGGAFAAGKHHGSKASAASGLTIGSFVASATNKTTKDNGPGHGPSDELAAAATYLGLSQADLQTALQSGKTLAQVADATSGKSTTGLIDALVAAEKTELAAAVTAGKLTQAQADQIAPSLEARFTDLVNGVRPAHGPGFGHGFGHGGPGGGDLAAAATYLGLSQADLQTALAVGQDPGSGRRRHQRQVGGRPDRRPRRSREDRARSGSDGRQAHPGAGRPDDDQPQGPLHRLRQRRAPRARRVGAATMAGTAGSAAVRRASSGSSAPPASGTHI